MDVVFGHIISFINSKWKNLVTIIVILSVAAAAAAATAATAVAAAAAASELGHSVDQFRETYYILHNNMYVSLCR